MMEMSRRPESDMCSVRGIGVADRASTSTSSRSERRSSFCATPKRCSSSRTTRPDSWGSHRARGRGACRSGPRPSPSLNSPPGSATDLRVCGSATPSPRAPGSRDSARGRCSNAAREDRRRAEDKRLSVVHGSSERRPDRDLRLPEADVAADEPVHRAAAPRSSFTASIASQLVVVSR